MKTKAEQNELIKKHINEYGEYASKLLPSTFLTATLAASVSSFVPMLSNLVSSVVPSWALPLVMIVASTVGLWFVNRKVA